MTTKLKQPSYRAEQVLVASDSLEDKQYLAFPITHRISDSEILVSFKRGYRHAHDRESVWQMVRFNPVTTEVSQPVTITEREGVIFENGEWVALESGDIDLYLDVQTPGSSRREGLEVYRSSDLGRTFRPRGRFGQVDGVEYGYCFQGLVDGPMILLLIMTFEYLTGGKRAVHVVGSDDGGRSWGRLRNLSFEFGNLPINETNMIRHDGGFLIVTRGYDGMARIHKCDTNFKLIRQVNLTEENDFMKRFIARPRIFERHGGHYLMGRNYTTTPAAAWSEWPMELCFYRIDPDSFEIISFSVLDNVERRLVTDGYYATPYWQERNGQVFFNAITYRGIGCHLPKNMDFPVDPSKPDIVRLEYLWDEIR